MLHRCGMPGGALECCTRSDTPSRVGERHRGSPPVDRGLRASCNCFAGSQRRNDELCQFEAVGRYNCSGTIYYTDPKPDLRHYAAMIGAMEARAGYSASALAPNLFPQRPASAACSLSSPSSRRSSSCRQRPRRPAPVAAAAAAAGGPPPRPAAAGRGLVAAGPASPPPDYAAIDARPLNRLVYSLFRNRMAQAIGADSKLEG